MTAITVSVNHTSQPHFVPAGALVTVAPGAGATAKVECTTASAAEIANRVATWAEWPKGQVTSSATELANNPMYVRITAIGGSVTLDIDQTPSAGRLVAFRANWGGQGGAPTITGAGSVGSTLTAALPAGVTGTIQFTRTLNGVTTAIAGAVANAVNSLAYTVQASDVGYRIDCYASNTVVASTGVSIVAAPVISVPSFLGQIATGTFVNDGVSANRYIGARSPHVMMKRGGTTGLRIVYGNWRVANGVETDNTASQTYKTAIEYPAGTFTPVFYGGQRVGTAAPGATLVSDRCAVNIPEGAKFWVRTLHDAGTVGQLFTYYSKDGTEYLQGSTTAGTVPDYVDGGGQWTGQQTAGTQGTMLMPQAIIDETTTPVVGIYGSSTPVGRGDVGAPGSGIQGFMARAYGVKYPILNAAVSGDSLQKFIASNTKRRALMAYCSHVALSMGSNDITGGRTSQQALADAATVIQYFTDAGKKVAFTTITDITTSTDAWATTANQTVTASESERLAFNAAVKTGLAGVTAVLDALPYTESAEVGKWKPNYTADGTHQTATAAAAAAAGVNVASLVF